MSNVINDYLEAVEAEKNLAEEAHGAKLKRAACYRNVGDLFECLHSNGDIHLDKGDNYILLTTAGVTYLVTCYYYTGTSIDNITFLPYQEAGF